MFWSARVWIQNQVVLFFHPVKKFQIQTEAWWEGFLPASLWPSAVKQHRSRRSQMWLSAPVSVQVVLAVVQTQALSKSTVLHRIDCWVGIGGDFGIWYLPFIMHVAWCMMHDAFIMHDERWGARLWKYSDQSVNVRGNSGFGATTRMHLSCSLVAASASSVQRVLDNLFCISGICMCRGVVRLGLGIETESVCILNSGVALFYQCQAKCYCSSRCL